MISDIVRQNQSAYDQLVEVYAERNHGAMAAPLRMGAERLARHTGRSGRIVEIGCGTGRDMAWLEALGLHVTGTDLSWGMLSYARKVVRGPLLMMEMRRLALASEHFDGAWCCASLLHLPKREAPLALQEIHRVLRPGGMLVLFVQQGQREQWEAGYGRAVERFFARYQAPEMAAMLAECHFSVVESGLEDAGVRQWLHFICCKQ